MRRDYPDFGLLHDLSHIYLCHEEPSVHMPLIREHLVAVHMGSSVSDRKHALFGDTHPLFGMPEYLPRLQPCRRTRLLLGVLRSHVGPDSDPRRFVLDRGVCVAHLQPQQPASVRSDGHGPG